MHRLAAVLLVLIPQAQSAEVPVVTAPAIDGKADEACWKSAADLGGIARVCRDADRLFIAVTSKEDRVSLRISPGGDRNEYYLVAITRQGKVETQYREDNPPWYDITWQPKLEAAAKAGDAGWTAEIALPFDGFALCRRISSKSPFEVASWRGTLTGIPARELPSAESTDPTPVTLGPGSAHPGTTGEVR